MLHVTHAAPLEDYRIEIAFNDGKRGVADISCMLDRGVFKSLADKAVFRQLMVDSDLETVVWPGGLDLAPEYLYFQAFKSESALKQQFAAWGYL